MTLSADSFAGRVLAAFSRRSPGFRSYVAPPASLAGLGAAAVSPPTPTASPGQTTPGLEEGTEAGTGRESTAVLSLAAATARWKSAPPDVRLGNREVLLELADNLKHAQRMAEAIVRLPGIGPAFDIAIGDGRTYARDLVRCLSIARAHAHAIDRALAHALDRCLIFARSRILATELSLALADSHDNLTEAANNFIDADISTVDLAKIDLSWIRWDSGTRWPGQEWAERIYRVSVENPPGSGIFITLPGEIRARSAAVPERDHPRDPSPSRRTAIAAGMVAMVLALSVMVGGKVSRPAPRLAPTPFHAPLMFGDPRAADPCALVDPAAFARYGRTELTSDYGNFNRCDVIVRSGRSEVDVNVELDTPADEAPGRVDWVGAIGVVRKQANGDECDRTLLLPDRSRVHIAAQRDSESHTDLCVMADAATKRAVAVLSRGEVPRRAVHPFPASLFYVDSCALLNASALTRAGVDALHPETGFGGWSCRWNSPTSPSALQLIFDRKQPLTADAGRPIRLGGHKAFVKADGYGEKTCMVSVVHRRYVDADGQPKVEVLRVVVTSPQPSDRRCALATSLAGTAAVRLPRT